MEKQEFRRQKLKEKYLGKLFEDDGNEVPKQISQISIFFDFPNPKTQNQIESLKPKNTFENLFKTLKKVWNFCS